MPHLPLPFKYGLDILLKIRDPKISGFQKLFTS